MYIDSSRFRFIETNTCLFFLKNVFMMFADFSMGETKEGERGGLFTRNNYGIRRCHLG